MSRLPQRLGLLPEDVQRIAQYVNAAQERLLNCPESNEEGWSGGYAEMAFTVNRHNPYITCPRGVARLLAADGCQRPIPLHNSFYEYLDCGTGRMPKMSRWSRGGEYFGRMHSQGYERNYACTMEDISNPPQQIQVFAVNSLDTQQNANGFIPRVLLQGLDQNGRVIYSQDNGVTVEGEFVTLEAPYVLSVNTFSTLTGVQKDITQGQVQIFQSDPAWGTSEILSTMEPTETTGWYRRYYFSHLPRHCCPSFRPIIVNQQSNCPHPAKEWVMVTALAKLELIPAIALTDYLLIQSLEGIISECQSIRMAENDDQASQAMSEQYHADSVKILRGQSISREGKNNVAANVALFGRNRWGRVSLGMR